MDLDTASGLYGYKGSAEAAIVFNILYSILIGPHVLRWWWGCRTQPAQHRYTVCLAIAAIISTAGYATRTSSVKAQDNVSLYAASCSLVMLSPIFICASLYLLIRIIQLYLPVQSQVFFHLSPQWLGLLFISSDALSLITQGAGSGIAASARWQGSSGAAGVDVLVVGLALQLATVTVFLVVTWQFVGRLSVAGGGRFEPSLKKMVIAVWITAIMVEVRCLGGSLGA